MTFHVALLGAYLTGVAVGLLVAGLIAAVIHTGRRRGDGDADGPGTWPLPLLLGDDETEWIHPTNLRDLPRRQPAPPSPQRRTQ